MSSLILPRRFTSQPQGPVEVDWSNPLTQGLLSLVDASGVDVAAGRLLSKSGAAEIGVTHDGVSLRSTGTGYWLNSVSIPSTKVSVFAYGYPTDLSLGKGYLLDLPSAPLALGSNYDTGTSLSVETGLGQRVVLASYYPKTSPTAVGATITAAWGTLKLYADGKLAASGGAGGFAGDTALRIAENNAHVLVAAVWGRVLSEGEFRQLSDFPWQLFRAKPRVLYFTTAGGGAITLNAANASSATSATAGVITQTHALASTNASSATATTAGAITQTHILSAANASSATSATAGAISVGAVISFTAASITSSTSATSGAIGQTHILGASNALSATLGSAAQITQTHNLLAANAISATVATSGAISTSTPGTGTLTPETIAAIADAVWAHSSATDIAIKLAEAWGRLGLDPSKPLISGQTEISFGAIVMALAGNETSSTLTRQ